MSSADDVLPQANSQPAVKSLQTMLLEFFDTLSQTVGKM
jgi:hypothetical protein